MVKKTQKLIHILRTCVIVTFSVFCIFILTVVCYVCFKPWEIRIPTFECVILHADNKAGNFICDSESRWSIGPNVVLMGLTETLLYGLIMQPNQFDRLDSLKKPCFFILEKRALPEKDLTYEEFIVRLRAHSVYTVELYAPFASETRAKVKSMTTKKTRLRQ